MMRVPVELLIQIVEDATLPACPLSYARDTATLHALCLVSRTVRAIAAPLLYATITVGSPAQLSLLLRTLRDPTVCTPPITALNIGIASDDASAGSGRSPRELVSLFSYTPQLRRLLINQALPLYGAIHPIFRALGAFDTLEELVLRDARRSFRWTSGDEASLTQLRRIAVFGPSEPRPFNDRDLWEVPGDLWDVPRLEVLVYGAVCVMSPWQCREWFPAVLRRRRASALKKIVLLNPPGERWALKKDRLRDGLRSGLSGEKWPWDGAEVVVVGDVPEAGARGEDWRDWMMARAQEGTLWDLRQERLFP